jgi:acyl-CoA thioesterase YciA
MQPKPRSSQPAIRTVMMPKDTNAYGSIFGGVILSLIDLAAAVEAERQAPRRFVTVAMDKVEFHCPVRVGQIVTLWAEAIRIGRSSITVRVRVVARGRGTADEDRDVTSAEVTMVAIDRDDCPVAIGSEPLLA